MVKGILASAGAMRPAMLAQEVLANNLANASTKGFRQDRFAFQQLMSSTANTATVNDVVTAPQLSTKLDTTAGAYQVTERKLDLAVQGDGYFVVQTPDGERYTRAGHFQVTPEGVITTAEGFPLMADGGPITITEPENLFVAGDGTVREGNQNLGKLQIVGFGAETPLTHGGGGLLIAEGEATAVEGAGVMQGVLEGPNVDAVQAMVEMITLLRHFEMNQKALQAQDESLGNLLAWVKA
jgi:flagellar basal-body rod protein FlgF